jgi:hypothetical protein
MPGAALVLTAYRRFTVSASLRMASQRDSKSAGDLLAYGAEES